MPRGKRERTVQIILELREKELEIAQGTPVPVAVTAGDRIERLRQQASGRCLTADRAVVCSRSEVGGGRGRRVMRESGVSERE